MCSDLQIMAQAVELPTYMKLCALVDVFSCIGWWYYAFNSQRLDAYDVLSRHDSLWSGLCKFFELMGVGQYQYGTKKSRSIYFYADLLRYLKKVVSCSTNGSHHGPKSKKLQHKN